MNISIAAWHLQDGNVGVGRYCLGLLKGLNEIERRHQYEILVNEKSTYEQVFLGLHFKRILVPFFRRRMWEQIAPLVGKSHDILHFPYDSSVRMSVENF